MRKEKNTKGAELVTSSAPFVFFYAFLAFSAT
jgi:hypothetical protein